MWYRDWPLGRPDAPPSRTFVVAGGRVVAATADLPDIRPGMTRREAEGLSPGATVLGRDLAEEALRFEPVVAAVSDAVPAVEVVEPGLLLVRLAGAVRYYGSEERVVEEVGGRLVPGFRIGVAEGPFAATWAARTARPGEPRIVADTAAFLAGLDVSTLEVSELAATFRWLGVRTLGELAALPREAIASRVGEAGLAAHRVASGEDRDLAPRPIPPDLAVEAVFEEPIELVDQAAFVSRSLAARLAGGLRRHGAAAHRVVVELEAADGTVRTRTWRSADPFGEEALADRVWWQLRAWIEGPGRGPGGIVRIRLDPSDVSSGGRQLAFFDDVSARVEAERALARAQALVGPDGVLQASPQGGRTPAEKVSWRRWGDEPPAPERDPAAPWPGATPAPTPALVPLEPPILDVEWDDGLPVRVRLGARWEPVLSWAGPWRLTGRWWRGEGAADRYQLVTSAGAFLCLVSGGRTYLAGIYD